MTPVAGKTGDALYIVILRAPDAQNQLTKWANSNRNINARVEADRMYIYNHTTLSLFMVTWTHSWENLVIWDTWTKRHLSF
jgi:hypothetical protein